MRYFKNIGNACLLSLALVTTGCASQGMAAATEKPSIAQQLKENLKRAFSDDPHAPRSWEEGYEGPVEPVAQKKAEPRDVSIDESAIGADIQRSYYIDSVAGNDGASGLTPDSAWRSIDKLKSAKIDSNSEVLFKRGGVYRGAIEAKPAVTYGAYGSGDKPLILGSAAKDKESDWSAAGGRVWKSVDQKAFAVDAGNMIFDGGKATAVKVFDKGKLKNDLDFYYDKKERAVYLYSQQNPAARFDSVEVALGMGIFKVKDARDVIIRDLELRYTGAHAISIEDSKNVKVSNVDIAYIGGTNLFSIIGIPGVKRFGNGIEIYGSAEDILVENSTVREIYDAALTNQSYEKPGHQNNIIYRNNKVINAEYCFEIWYYAKKSSMKNVLFEGNECAGTGKSWGHFQRPDGVNARNVMVFSNTAETENVVIRNNTFFEATESHVRFADPADEREFTFINNTFAGGR